MSNIKTYWYIVKNDIEELLKIILICSLMLVIFGVPLLLIIMIATYFGVEWAFGVMILMGLIYIVFISIKEYIRSLPSRHKSYQFWSNYRNENKGENNADSR